MPTFSIVIPAYNNASLLGTCLGSIKQQSFTDWEAIVVNDASPDDMEEVARRESEGDARIIVINKPANEGLHLARKTGTEAANGDYVMYLDADDELMPGALEAIHVALMHNPADLLRVGTRVISAGASEQDCIGYENRANRAFPTMTGKDSIRLSYEPEAGFQQDWRTWANVLMRDVAQRAFQQMTDQRLERAEDALEFLAFASLSERQVTRTDIIAYCYHFGCGVTGPSPLSANQFCVHARQFADCIHAIDEYCASFAGFDLTQAAAGARIKLREIMFNDWRARVPDSEKADTYPELISLFGKEAVATQLMRLVRDAAYEEFVTSGRFNDDDAWVGWYETADALMRENEAPSQLYLQVSAKAKEHIADLQTSKRLKPQAQQDIRIFVSTHTDTAYFDSELLQMVQVGSKRASRRFAYCFHDDEGENISDLNPMYCELTAQYWAWKNVDAEYYGFCHYRRYFDFSEERHKENSWGEVMERTLDSASQLKYGLDDESIRAAVSGYDVITTEFKKLADFPDDAATPLQHWQQAPLLYDNDLIDVFAITCDLHPDYTEDVLSFAVGSTACFCNMFIMKKEIFHDYCAWLFPILERFCQTHDMSHYSRETLRTPGHLSERLLNIYLLHHERIGAHWKTKQCQCVHFENTAPFHLPTIPGEWETKFKPIIPVVLAADNNYVPMLATTMCSLLANASDAYHYHITVLTNNISHDNQMTLKAFAQQMKAASVQFLNVSQLINIEELSTNNPHISVETYYRFLIQDILPDFDKVVYLDSDLIVRDDISELYNIDLGDSLIAAVRDVDYLGNLNFKDGERLAYTKSVLGMDNPYDYFQAGVLVLNTKALRKDVPSSIWFEEAKDTRYIYNDQDILNARCEGRVTFLDPRWNVMHDGLHRIDAACSKAPAPVFQEYLDARKDEKVIHYAGVEKPWNTFNCDRALEYWRYARQTPYYEKLVAFLSDRFTIDRENADYQLIDDNSFIRKIVDPIFPPDSQRRETVRSLVKRVKRLTD